MAVEWKGIFPAVTTKFSDDGAVDLEACMHNIQAQLDAGVHGIILGGTLGEASTLSSEEKITLLRATVDFVAKRVPVILNVAEQSTEDAIAAALAAEENGADGLMLLPPMRYPTDKRETVTYLKTVANATKLPILLYNNPVDYKIELTMDMFEEFKECANIQAVKETTRDISNVTRMRRQFGERFKILNGLDTLGMESLVMGSDGWVAGLVCAFPRETVAIYELIQQGRYEEAREIYRWFLPLLELDINTKLVQNIKMAEAAVGLGNENVRAPRLPLAGSEREEVQAIIEEGLRTRPELPQF